MYLKFMCRPSKMLQNGLCPLELSIIIEGKRKIIRFQKFIKASDFNAPKQYVKRNPEVNEYMESIRAKFYSIETEMLQRNIPITTQNVLDIYKNGFAETKLTVLMLFDMHNNEANVKQEQQLIVKATYQKYLLTRKYLAEFLRQELNKDDILLVDITPTFIEQFFLFLNNKMDKNTAIHKMKLFKKILRIAQEEGYIRSMPFKLKLVAKNLEYNPLTVDEIRIIRNKELHSQRIQNVRDLFIFACYTGLSFTDLIHLTKANIHIDENGDEWIIKKRQKTEITSYIPLLPIAKEIWIKYDYHLPSLSNQKYNSYLHEIADICGIDKHLHSHLARHTFATILLNSGVDIISVSKILGHSNSRITEKTYAKMMPETIKQRVDEVANRLV